MLAILPSTVRGMENPVLAAGELNVSATPTQVMVRTPAILRCKTIRPSSRIDCLMAVLFRVTDRQCNVIIWAL